MNDPAALFWIDDAQWQQIVQLLPSEPASPRQTGDRIVLSGILHVLRSGCAWRDCPAIYGSHLTLINRFNALKSQKTLTAILTTLKVEVAPPRSSEFPLEESLLAPAATAVRLSDLSVPRSEEGERPIALPESDSASPGVSARDIATAHVRKLVIDHTGKPIEKWIDATVTWHLDFIERARVDYWVPGTLGNQDPNVRKAVDRFHLHQVQTTVNRLTLEAHELRISLLKAIACISYYAEKSNNSGFAKTTLKALVGATGIDPTEGAPGKLTSRLRS